MKILINTSNLYVGGGVQVALSFIDELRKLNLNHQYFILLSPVISKQIDQNLFTDNFQFFLIDKSPASLKNRKIIVNKLIGIEKQINPNMVFTLFGPAYWKPQVKHLMGFALGWITNPHSIAYSELSLLNRIKKRTENIYKSYYLKKNADYYVVETNDVKNKLINVIGIKDEKIKVIGNTCSSVYNQSDYEHFEMPKEKENTFRMVTISHNYPHKNLKIIKDIIPYLKNSPVKIEFIVTIDKLSYEKLYAGLKENVINIGPVETRQCPSIYQQSDAMFLPTLLESFSASYPEALKMKLPILTSDYSFATVLCKDAAMYFDPLNPKEIAEKIIKLSTNKKMQKDLVAKGTKVLQTFETAESRAKKYIELCEQIVNDRI